MMTESKIVLELSIREAIILRNSIASSLPVKEDEMISMLLYARLAKKIDEQTGKNESR